EKDDVVAVDLPRDERALGRARAARERQERHTAGGHRCERCPLRGCPRGRPRPCHHRERNSVRTAVPVPGPAPAPAPVPAPPPRCRCHRPCPCQCPCPHHRPRPRECNDGWMHAPTTTDVSRAAHLLRPVVRRTPLETDVRLSELVDHKVLV